MRNGDVLKIIMNLVEWILDEIASGKRLVIGKDDTVVLCVAFVTSLHRPLIRFLLLWTETSNVVREHVKVRPVVNYPAGELLCTATTQHHTSAVESAVVE